MLFISSLSFQHCATQLTKTAFPPQKHNPPPPMSPLFCAAETLIHAFTTSPLDSCNSIIYGSFSKVLHKLQHIQNSAARLHQQACSYLTASSTISILPSTCVHHTPSSTFHFNLLGVGGQHILCSRPLPLELAPQSCSKLL